MLYRMCCHKQGEQRPSKIVHCQCWLQTLFLHSSLHYLLMLLLLPLILPRNPLPRCEELRTQSFPKLLTYLPQRLLLGLIPLSVTPRYIDFDWALIVFNPYKCIFTVKGSFEPVTNSKNCMFFHIGQKTFTAIFKPIFNNKNYIKLMCPCLPKLRDAFCCGYEYICLPGDSLEGVNAGSPLLWQIGLKDIPLTIIWLAFEN